MRPRETLRKNASVKERCAAIAERIRVARVLAHMTQIELAKLVGVQNPCVSLWENGLRCPASYHVARIAEATGVTVGAILGVEPLF